MMFKRVENGQKTDEGWAKNGRRLAMIYRLMGEVQKHNGVKVDERKTDT